eukprot:scaffold217931_cov17-Tisochrysis_lutea.AAC.1
MWTPGTKTEMINLSLPNQDHVVVAAADRRMGSCLWRWGVWKCVQIFITATACATNHWINTTGNAFCHPCPENTETLAVGE